MSKGIEKINGMEQTLAPMVDCNPLGPQVSQEEYTEWFRARVQEALDEPDEKTCPHEEVMASTQAIIDQKRLEKELRERAKS